MIDFDGFNKVVINDIDIVVEMMDSKLCSKYRWDTQFIRFVNISSNWQGGVYLKNMNMIFHRN